MLSEYLCLAGRRRFAFGLSFFTGTLGLPLQIRLISFEVNQMDLALSIEGLVNMAFQID
jgi:hypothetical protein